MPKKDKNAEARGGGLNCPVCNEFDAVQRVRTIIDGGIGNTAGGALSVPIFGKGAMAVTGFSSQSVTQLANRLGPYRSPRPGFWRWFFLAFLLSWILPVSIAAQQATTNSPVSFILALLLWLYFLIIPMVIIAVILAFIFRAIKKATQRPALARWSVCATTVYEAFYCFRDDTMFNSEMNGRPEDFIANAFR